MEVSHKPKVTYVNGESSARVMENLTLWKHSSQYITQNAFQCTYLIVHYNFLGSKATYTYLHFKHVVRVS